MFLIDFRIIKNKLIIRATFLSTNIPNRIIIDDEVEKVLLHLHLKESVKTSFQIMSVAKVLSPRACRERIRTCQSHELDFEFDDAPAFPN